ncbi:hypothetical protein [Magnetovibrio sp.]|uniref:hypothetical protein n=1 Tax=Magnetovibrio sp. TaxID=2024836 RepID=UPI002F94A66F
MDTLTFISTIVSAVVWPLLILVLALVALHKAPILASLIKTIRYKEVEVTFQEAREILERTSLGLHLAEIPPLNPNDKILKLAAVDTGAAIMEIWKSLEAVLYRLIQNNGMMRFTNPTKFVDVLCSEGKISDGERELFHSLRRLRNQSVHALYERSPTIAEVVEFQDFVTAFSERLEQIREEPEYINVPIKDEGS